MARAARASRVWSGPENALIMMVHALLGDPARAGLEPLPNSSWPVSRTDSFWGVCDWQPTSVAAARKVQRQARSRAVDGAGENGERFRGILVIISGISGAFFSG